MITVTLLPPHYELVGIHYHSKSGNHRSPLLGDHRKYPLGFVDIFLKSRYS
jgi:hypothetical protein